MPPDRADPGIHAHNRYPGSLFMSYIETPSPFAAGTQPDAIPEFAFEDPRDNALGLRDRALLDKLGMYALGKSA